MHAEARRLRWTVDARIDGLVDPGSADPALARSGALRVGAAAVDGRPIVLLASDVRIERGALSADDARRAADAIGSAGGRPVVWLLDSDGARVRDGLPAVQASAALLAALAEQRGHSLRLACNHGLGGGVAAYALALCDAAIAVADRSFTFVAGPAVVRASLGREEPLDALGGTALHARRGTLAATVLDDAGAIAWLRAMLAFEAPHADPRPPALAAPPPLPPHARPYDARAVLDATLDAASWLPLYDSYAPSALTGLGRVRGCAVAVIASQPRHRAGAIDADAAQKIARHLGLARDRGLPVLTLCDTPGFLPGSDQEEARVLVHGAALLHAYAAARAAVPTASVVVRRAAGAGAVLAFGSAQRARLPGATLVQMGDDAARAAYDAETEAGDAPFPEIAHEALRAWIARWLQAPPEAA